MIHALAEIQSVQKQKASSFTNSLDMQYEKQAQWLTYAGVISNDSILLPKSVKLVHLDGRDTKTMYTAVQTKFPSPVMRVMFMCNLVDV